MLAGVRKWAWVLFLVALPLTSFPYFPPGLGGKFLVRPLSLYPLLVLLIFVVVPHLLRRPVPRTFQTILPFVFVATFSSVLALLSGINSNFGVSVPQRLLRALITLGIGLAFYFTVALTPQSRDDLKTTLRWLYLGFAIALLWGSLQAVYVVRFSPAYFDWISRVQGYLTMRHLFTNRISGLTFEPKWFAEQISFLLMPWLFAAVTRNYTVFRWRWGRLTVEALLLVWSTIVLTFTFSRAGLLLLFVQLGLAFLLVGGQVVNDLSPRLSRVQRRLGALALALVGMLGLAGFIFLAGANNGFFARMWNYWTSDQRAGLREYFDYVGFGPRLMYGVTAYRIYEQHPVLGVGLGNYAFYFEDLLPDRSLAASPEILRMISMNVTRYQLVTPKNLYLRILAETGLLGLGTFLVFPVAVLGCALYLISAPDPEQRYWGLAGVFGLLSFGLASMTYDSFAIPNMWIVFGLITSSAWLFYRVDAGGDRRPPGAPPAPPQV